MTNNEIVATAIDFINAPRTWGKSINNTLSDLVGQALVRATHDSPLCSEEFEAARRLVLQALRTPQSA
jgi:hypothetical protein